MNIEYIDIDQIEPYERNPRRNDDAVESVANSIKEFGFKVPIVIDKNNVVVTGHTRLKAAKQLGIDKIPCIVANDLSDAQIKAYRLADNRTAENSFWDYRALDKELSELLEMDGLEFSMEDFGFDDLYVGDTMDDIDNEEEKELEKQMKDKTKVETKTKCPKCGYEW